MSYANIQAQQASLSYVAVFGAAAEVAFAAPSEDCPQLSKYLICLDEIKFGGKTFQLNHAISVILYQEDGLWYCEHTEYGILSAGTSAVEAVCSFAEDFDMVWDVIAQRADDSLTIEAQKVKQAMLGAVKKVVKR